MERKIARKRASKAPHPVNADRTLDSYLKSDEVTIVEVPRPNTTPVPRKLAPPPLKRSPTPPPLPISQMPLAPHPPVHVPVSKYDSEVDIDTSPENVKVTVYQKIFVVLDSMPEHDKLSALSMIEAFALLSPRERSALSTIVEKLAGSR